MSLAHKTKGAKRSKSLSCPSNLARVGECDSLAATAGGPGMTTATEAQKMRLAEAFLRLAREALRGVPTDLGAAENFGNALFECPDSSEDVARLVQQLCPAEEWPEIARVLDDFSRA